MTLLIPTPGSLNCPPRFATPRNPDRPTWGGEIGEVARRLGQPLMAWQQIVADVSYEYDPDTGLLFYDEDDVTVPRQSGKTTYIRAKKVHRSTVVAARYGPQRSAYYAQTRLAARRKLERDFAPALRSSRSFSEVPHSRARPTRPTQWRLSLNNGSEAIEFGNGSLWGIDAPSRTGGHGDTLDDADIDEAFAHYDDTVEGSVRPAQATRVNAKLGVFSTAGDALSKYLYRKVLAGRAACATGDHGRVAYFEWSAPDDADPGDPATWWGCMPALGITITEEFIRGEWDRAQRKGLEGIDTFRRAYLNQWPEVPVLDDDVQFRVLPGPQWHGCERVGHKPTGKLRYALDVDTNANGEEWCSIGCSDGVHLELVTPPDVGMGTNWVVPAVVAKRDVVGELVLDPNGPAGKLIDPLVAAGVPVRAIKSGEFTQASMQLLDAVVTEQVRHIDQARLNRAVAGVARRDVGDGAWRFSRKLSPVDISPLVAVTLARWAACSTVPVAAPGFMDLDEMFEE